MSTERKYSIYLLVNGNNKVIYGGMTRDLQKRIYEHKQKRVKGCTEKQNVNKLVYSEETTDVPTALAREKEIKTGRREKKDTLVKTMNPAWRDLSLQW